MVAFPLTQALQHAYFIHCVCLEPSKVDPQRLLSSCFIAWPFVCFSFSFLWATVMGTLPLALVFSPCLQRRSCPSYHVRLSYLTYFLSVSLSHSVTSVLGFVMHWLMTLCDTVCPVTSRLILFSWSIPITSFISFFTFWHPSPRLSWSALRSVTHPLSPI